MIRKKMSLICGAAAFLILVLDSRAAAHAAAEGVLVCIRTVIPCLFPFFVLSGYMTAGLRGGKTVARLFHCPENCGLILLTGLLGGYPVGAKQAAEGYCTGTITKELGDRLLWFCSQAGPSFLFGIAAAQVGGVREGWILWGIQMISALSVAWILPMKSGYECSLKPSQRTKTNIMTSALNAIASVCGWVIVFQVVLSFLKRWVLFLLPESFQILICGLLELTNGCLLLGEIPNVSLRMLLAAVMLNFGGVCVMMQTVSLTEGLDFRGYLLGKLLQTAFAALYTLLWIGQSLALIPILCVFLVKILSVLKNRGSILAKNGV